MRRHMEENVEEKYISPLLTSAQAIELAERYKNKSSRIGNPGKHDDLYDKLYAYAAVKGDVGAQFALASSYDIGKRANLGIQEWEKYTKTPIRYPVDLSVGKEKLNEAAMFWYKKAADQGHTAAQFRLGEVYLEDGDFFEAEKWFKQAADNGSLMGKFGYGMMLYAKEDGSGKEEALALFEYAAERGLVLAQEKLFLYYYEARKFEEAQHWAEYAQMYGSNCIPDDFAAWLYYSNISPKNYGLIRNILHDHSDEAKNFGRNSAIIGRMYYLGEGIERDPETAYLYFMEAGTVKDMGANKMMDHLVRTRLLRIVRWLKRNIDGEPPAAINLSDDDCKVLLGLYQYYGRGVRKDVDEAIRLWEIASENGSELASRMLAKAFFEGKSITLYKRNLIRSKKILLELADKGNKQAMADLKKYGLVCME